MKFATGPSHQRDLVLANSNVLSAVAVLVILGLMVVPVPPTCWT